MPPANLANATDLDGWAARRLAQGVAPHLYRQLIVATVTGLQEIRMVAGDAVQQRGWDGFVLSSDDHPLVPAGASAWEIGTGENPTDKATRDYKQRTRNPLEVDPTETTYVAATLRRWPAKDRWAASRRKSGPWKSVIALDADDLETWLDTAPAVHLWISGQIGKPVAGAQDLLSFWHAWITSTEPHLTRDMVIGARDSVVEQLSQWVRGEESTLALKAATPEEALAFLTATIVGLPPQARDSLLTRALIIRDQDAWVWAKSFSELLLLIPLWADRVHVGDAVRAGHRVIAPLGAGAPVSMPIEIGKPSVESLAAGLVASGVGTQRARKLARIGRRSLQAMRRQIALRRELECPDWVKDADIDDLIAALLAGAWDAGAPGDCEVMGQLAGLPWSDFERILVRRAEQPDAAVQRVGRVWLVASKEDCWSLVRNRVTEEDLGRFGEIVTRVLGAPDPALDLARDEQWMANVLGHARPHSTTLRAGLADTLAFFGALEPLHQAIDQSASDMARYVVRRLLRAANADPTGSLWLSIADVLTLLAEAAPEEFLDGVEQGPLVNEELARVFFDSEPSVFGGGGRHGQLIDALETLAWSADYLGRSSLAVAKLARLCGQEPRSNSPQQSLRATFFTVYPQTAASPEERLEVIDRLRRCEPEGAWDLMVGVVPRRREIVFSRPGPSLRDWKPELPAEPDQEAIDREREAIVDRLLEDVVSCAERWPDLLGLLTRIPQHSLSVVVARLEALDPETLSDDVRADIRNELRRVLNRSLRDGGERAGRASEIVHRLRTVYDLLLPPDPVARHLWLFGHSPRLLNVDDADFDMHALAVDRARTSAVEEVVTAGGFPEVTRLIDRADAVSDVGRLLAGVTAEFEAAMVQMLGSGGNREVAAAAYVRARFESGGWSWADRVVGRQGLSPTRVAAFFAALPLTPDVWDRVDALGDEVKAAYWGTVRAWGVQSGADVTRAAQSLARYGRAWDAIEALSYARHAGFFDPDLTVSILMAAAAQQGADSVRLHSLDWWIGELFDDLASAGIPDALLGELEWIYLPVLDDHRAPRCLHAALGQDAAFFVELVCLIYRASDDNSPRTEERSRRAAAAHRLLDSWRTPPGVRADGSVDKSEMTSWITWTRRALRERKRVDIGDQAIGRILRYVPRDPDGIWPHQTLRDVLEEFAAPHIEKGIVIEVLNSRGFTERDLYEGGQQERDLAETFLDGAEKLRTSAPRTAAILRELSRDYARDATREDLDAELMHDLWG